MNLQATISGSVLAGALLSHSGTIQPLIDHSGALKQIVGDKIVLGRGLAEDIINNIREIERAHPIASILDTAIAAGTFKTLVRAIEAAGLVEMLSREGPFTLFAPTDKAFAKFSEDQLDLLFEDRQKLRALLAYHVIPGWVTTRDAAKLETARTLHGQNVRIRVNGGGVTVNSANVTRANVVAANGIVHAIDTVISPDKVAASAAAASSSSANSGAFVA